MAMRATAVSNGQAHSSAPQHSGSALAAAPVQVRLEGVVAL